jgi:NAD(P)-dependent dehydrogenase (short-subunit alcohol dehydrogenase family)
MDFQQFKQRVWFITGASSGFGLVLAKQALGNGNKVVATARKPEGQLANLGYHYADRCLVLPLDVTNQEQVDFAVAETIAKFGRIDVLVNNAGYGMAGAVEESAPEEFRPMFETNVFGLIRTTQAVLPHMREQNSGHILNLSSIGGLVATPGLGMYNATKFAVEGLSEALSQEVRPLGIHVTIVEPGPFRTDFLGRSGIAAALDIADYEHTAGKMREYFSTMDGKQKGDPARAAKAIQSVVDSGDPPLRLMLGASTIPRLKGKIEAMQREIDNWSETTIGADFPDGQ